MRSLLSLLVLLVVAETSNGLRVGFVPSTTVSASRTTPLKLGLFDAFKESEEQKRAKDREWEEMKKKQAMRRDPDAFEKEINKRRMQEAALQAAQRSETPVVVADGALPLPDGWKAVADPDGDMYYWNKESGVTQWERPTA